MTEVTTNWAFLVAQSVKNLPAVQEAQVRYLGWKIPWRRKWLPTHLSSVGKESTCNAGDLSSIPGSGRCPGEGKGYPLQYSWASLVAQLVKNSPAMRETWIQSLGWEDPLRRERLPTPVFWPGEVHGLYSPWGPKESDMTFTFTPSSILAWKILWTEKPGGLRYLGFQESNMT